MIRVSALYVYPIKGARAVALDRAQVERRGIAGDRRFMVVDEHGQFVTQRTRPVLARVDARFDGDALVVSSEGHGEVRVARAPSSAADRSPTRVTVWRDTVHAWSAGREAAAFFSALLGESVSLVYMPDSTERACSPKYASPGDITSFADAFPLLIANQSSLDDLNARMREPVPMNRFRPSVVVSGAGAWDEATWTRITIGDLPLRVVKGCERCVVTTTDQATGERGIEPLKTLATFRQFDNAVYFAENAVPDATGVIAIGDEVTVLERGPARPAAAPG